jgi:hypothetical protein
VVVPLAFRFNMLHCVVFGRFGSGQLRFEVCQVRFQPLNLAIQQLKLRLFLW